MKLPQWPSRVIKTSRAAIARTTRAAISALAVAAKTLLAPIGFREVLLLGGSALLGYGASFVYPPAAYLAPGVVLVGVAVLGVRA